MLIFLFLGVLSATAEEKYDSVSQISGKFRFMTSDPLGTLYLIRTDNSIEKYDAAGTLLKQVNHKVYGPLKSIDATNPFELYLYYSELGKVVITDNQLSIRGEIDFNPHLVMPAAIARSFDNGIWIFDLSDMELKKFGKNMLMNHHSGNILQITGAGELDVRSVADMESRVYLHNKTTGIEVFDNFANYIKTLPFPEINSWQVAGDVLYYQSDSRLVAYDMKFLSTTSLDIPVSEGWTHFRILGEYLFLHYPDRVVLLNRRK